MQNCWLVMASTCSTIELHTRWMREGSTVPVSGSLSEQ